MKHNPKLFFILLLGATLTASAEQSHRVLLDDSAKAKLRAKFEQAKKNSGGLIEKPGTGSIAIINCQSAVSDDVLQNAIRQFTKQIRVSVQFIKGDVPDVYVGIQIPKDAAAALYIINDKKLPMSIVSAEAHWGVLNICPIVHKVKSAVLVNERINKAFLRAAIATFGGGAPLKEGSVMDPVTSIEDIDSLLSLGITHEHLGGIKRNLIAMGVTEYRRATYRIACQEGWAPPPTNDVQKAIWEKVHSIPDKPMKIEFDPATQKGKVTK